MSVHRRPAAAPERSPASARWRLALAMASVACVFPFAATATVCAPAVMAYGAQAALIFGLVALRSSLDAAGQEPPRG